MRPLVILAFACAATGCDRPPAPRGASVTVKLPPARPYVPRPGFSTGAATGQDTAAPTQIDG